MRARGSPASTPGAMRGQAGGARGRASTRRTRPPWRSCGTGARRGRGGRGLRRTERELLHELWQRRDAARPPWRTRPGRRPRAARCGTAADPYAAARCTRQPVRRRTPRHSSPYRSYGNGRTGYCRRLRPTPPSASPAPRPSAQLGHPQQRRQLLHRTGARRSAPPPSAGPRARPGRPWRPAAPWACGDLVEGGEDPRPRSVSRCLAAPAARALSTVVPGRYLPVRKPEARAKYGTAARPVAGGDVLELALVGVAGDQVVVGLERDVAGEALAVGEVQGRLRGARGRCWRRRCARTLPAFTSSSRALMISSTGTVGSSKWV